MDCGRHSASFTYRLFFAGLVLFPCGKALWKAWAPAKCKLHFWLAMRRGRWRADRRLQHGMPSHVMCPLCDQAAETADHLALGCVYAREVWHSKLTHCGLGHLVPTPNDSLIEWWPGSRDLIPPAERKGFDSVAILTVWMLWKERNNRIFQRSAVVARELCRRIEEEVRLWKISGAKGLAHIWR